MVMSRPSPLSFITKLTNEFNSQSARVFPLNRDYKAGTSPHLLFPSVDCSFLFVFLFQYFVRFDKSFCDHVGAWEGRQGFGEGRSEAASQGAAGQHPGDHEAGHPASSASWRSEAHQWAYL
ncbi:hypothetical protein KC19_10G162000 [Ceratodon purpureus]|uniref:Uncharacterized protein n=1 Tax=Ceratodon purpureus TaxID=3225 RepID=A0A8T0GPQ9_CERPU|nr:hypothetical protein KC19_10G162000 [Ceratodon purpureus]